VGLPGLGSSAAPSRKLSAHHLRWPAETEADWRSCVLAVRTAPARLDEEQLMPQPPKFQPRRRNARNGPLVLPWRTSGSRPKWPCPESHRKMRTFAGSSCGHASGTSPGRTSVVRTVSRAIAARCRSRVALAQPAAARPGHRTRGPPRSDPKAMRLLLWQSGLASPARSRLTEHPDIRQRILAARLGGVA